MKTQYKLCVIPDYAGMLPIRDGINGPIHRPSKFTLNEIITIINHRIKIYEVNKYDKKKKVLLTLQNVAESNFPLVKRSGTKVKDSRKKRSSRIDALSVKEVKVSDVQGSGHQTHNTEQLVVSEKQVMTAFVPRSDTLVDTVQCSSAEDIEEVLKPDFF